MWPRCWFLLCLGFVSAPDGRCGVLLFNPAEKCLTFTRVVSPASSPYSYQGTLSKWKLTGVHFTAGVHNVAQHRLHRPLAPPCASTPPMIGIYREKMFNVQTFASNEWFLQLPPPSPLVVCSSGGDRKAVTLVVSLNATKKLTRSCWFTSSSHHLGIFYFSPINGKVPGRTSGVCTSRQRHSGPVRGKDDLKRVYRKTLRFYCADFSSDKDSGVHVGQINT